MWRFLSFVLDSILACECLICTSALRPFEPFSPAALPEGWPPDLCDFFFTDFRLPVFGDLSVRADILCPRCWLSLEPAPQPGLLAPPGSTGTPLAVVSPFYENDSLLALIRFLKFSGGRAAAPSLSWWMARALASHIGGERGRMNRECILVPVPLHPRRERSRGYNQAALLAHGVGERLGMEVDGALIARAKDTKPQSKLETRERAENVRGAFALLRGDRVNSKNIILVDDLVTTGDTIRACADALAAAAPAMIMVLCAGRVRDSLEAYPGLDRGRRIM